MSEDRRLNKAKLVAQALKHRTLKPDDIAVFGIEMKHPPRKPGVFSALRMVIIGDNDPDDSQILIDDDPGDITHTHDVRDPTD